MRQTFKLLEAEKTVAKHGLKHCVLITANEYYQLLEKNNYFWNSKTKKWEKAQKADPPTEKIRIRITTEGDWLINSDLLKRLEKAFESINLFQISQSKFYTQRPPNQLDSSIYFEFMDKSKGGK